MQVTSKANAGAAFEVAGSGGRWYNGGHRELVTHGETGTLFAPDDPLACAEALAGLLANRDGWDAYRIAGRRHVETRHDWAINAQRYQDVYQRLLPVGVQPAFDAAA